jgi:hypothetical protein
MEVSSKNSINNDKSLCLYCDKTFADIEDQKNHVEREHKTILYKGKGSRKSERITKNNLTSENSPFPGCFHCNKKIIRTDDLDNLFQHLLSSHKDVYFGCKCKIRTQDKVSLANHKKNCKIGGGGGGKSARCSEENVTDIRKTAKKSQATKNNGDSKCDSLSESEDNVSVAAANNSKTLPANAIHKKSDRSKLKNLSKNASVNDKGKKNKLSSSSSTTSSSSSNKTGEDEYTIPLTRQKLKEPPSRLGAAQNRTAGNKKSQKTNRAIEVKSITTSSLTKVNRTKTNKIVNASSYNNPEPVESVLKNEPVSFEFDEDFYRNISQNIRLNLTSFVDGKSDQLQNRCPMFDHISEQAVATCCTTEKKVAIPVLEKEIHEATNFELSTPPFPALLTAEQYGFGDSNPNKNKRQITKNSWKWKWDLIKKYKYVNEGGKIVKKVKQITTGLKDLSQLDMWTQLSMRSRYENLNTQNGETTEFDEGLSDTLSMRTIKTQNIEQLNTILDKRLTPEIDIEQLQQTVIKLEPEEKEDFCENFEAEGEADQNDGKPELLDMFNLVKTNVSKPSKTLLSGEWARPRCYICLDCGLKFDLMKSLNDHKNSEHPYVVSAHYEIVGRENLEQKLYKNLFLPKKALQTSGFARSLSVNSDSKSNETNEASTSSDNSSKFFADQKEKECSKCLKLIKYSSDIDIYKHILECIEDRAWMQAKRRSKYRRSRRKSRKTTRKSRLSIDQKKIASSPSTKDNTEGMTIAKIKERTNSKECLNILGENSTPSISNPPTPKSDPKTSTSISSKINKIEPLLTENKSVTGKITESMSIKNFFRVSKTTPIVTQKVVVQMLEIPPTNQSNSLRSSLRSSSAKRSANTLKNLKSNSTLKSNDSQNEIVQELSKVNDVDSLKDTCSEKIVTQNPGKNISDIESEAPITRCSEIKNPLIPLTICTPEKSVIDTQLISPTSSSSLVSPTSNSNVPKKKKKLNDCIAMLTCKIQAKLGVNFFDSISNQPSSPEQTQLVSPTVLTSQPVQKPAEMKPSTSFQIESLLKENKFSSPIQEEVIDLSVKKKAETEELKSDNIMKPTEITTTDEVVQDNTTIEIVQAKEEIAIVEKTIVEPNEETKIVEKECLKEKIIDLKESANTVEEIPSVPIQNELIIETTIEVEVKKRLTKRKEVKKKTAKKPTRRVAELPEETAEMEPKIEILEKDIPEIAETLEVPKLSVNEIITESIEKSEISTYEISQKSEPESPKPLSTDVEEILIEEFNIDESFKISIPKEKIPNLKEILDQYQVITVNNIKISESERRAFEEQKNRILQILNKTKNSNNKRMTAKKTAVRKAPMRKVPVRKNIKKKEQIVKSKPEIPIPEIEKTAEEIVEAKIEKTVEAIKTTNRIRCRRLSVVVDPIINLSAFQNKNRKIRLTNNSQQNGFYDLLAASEQFFAENKSFAKDKLKACPETSTVVEELKPDVEAKTEVPEPLAAAQEDQEIVATKPAIKATRAAKVTAKELILSDKSKEIISKKTENVSPQKPKTKATDKMFTTVEPLVEKECENATIVEPTTPEPEKLPTTPKKSSRGKKQNVENISTVVAEKEPENVSIEAENKAAEAIKDQPKSTRQKALAKNNKKKNVLPLEEIKVEQSVKATNVKEMPEKRRKLPRRKSQPAAKEENLLDISFSSDTSNENDIPLAQLIAPGSGTLKKQEVGKLIEFKDEVELDSAEQSELKKLENETLENISVLEEKHGESYELEIAEHKSETPTQQPKLSKAVTKKPTKKKQAVLAKTPVQEPKRVEKIQKILQDTPLLVVEEVEAINDEPQIFISQETRESEVSTEKPVDKFETFLNKTSSMIDLSASSDVDTKKSFDPFTINEDSFFNDDLDNDPSDKINDIVNNIINSSEFQIDSDTEKSEIYQGSVDGKNQPMPSCTICKRTFRTEKVWEKHCMTSTHIMKVQRKHRGIARLKESHGSKVQVQSEEIVAKERVPSPIFDEAKVFRTKGALKTFDTVLDTSVNEKPKVVEEVKLVEMAVVNPKNDLTREQKLLNANDDKIYYEFKMEKKPEDMTPKDKDQLFDSLFNSLEAKAQEKQTCYTPKPNLSVATPQDSEMESSSTSWDLKHDADIEWEGEPIENVPFAKAIKERYPKKFSVKVNRLKDTVVSIPTKSLIMGKIFKKHRDREIQKTPQANAPNNKPGIKNSLDEIFDHLKNTAEIDDKVLTCPSPKTLLKNAGGPFSPHSSLSNDMLETASQSNNNNIYKGKAVGATPDKEEKKTKVNINPDLQLLNDSTNEDGDDGVGKRKSRRRCAIKAKTFAETWSSDEYEELHDTEDIISIINEIEKRELIKKRKLAKFDSHLELVKKTDSTSDVPVKSDSIIKPSSIMKSSEAVKSAYAVDPLQKAEKKKSVQIVDILNTEKTSSTIRKRRMSMAKDGHKSDEETFTATKDALPLKICPLMKKRRMSCFVPSTPSFVERPKPKLIAKPIKEPPLRIEAEILKKFEKSHEILEPKSKISSVKKSDSEKSFKNQKKFVNLLANFGGQVGKKKVQKHRKRPRNKIKNIAYDSDSDFELNLNKKSRAAATTPAPFSESSSSSSEQDEEDNDVVIVTPKPTKSQTIINASRISNTNDMTMIKEPKLLPNDLKHVVPLTTSSIVKAAIPEDIMDPSQSACNRTKRHSSEKLYYWSSSSSESDQEQGDTADGDNEDSVMPHQPEQHGWIVGDSHKKLVTLLAHAKIKNKIN